MVIKSAIGIKDNNK